MMRKLTAKDRRDLLAAINNALHDAAAFEYEWRRNAVDDVDHPWPGGFRVMKPSDTMTITLRLDMNKTTWRTTKPLRAKLPAARKGRAKGKAAFSDLTCHRALQKW